jgi:hypothetical protein
MKTSDTLLTPQSEEDIQDAQWMSTDTIQKTVLSDTYNSIKELLKNFLDNE